MEALEEYMKKEHSVENLELYKSVREFRRKYNSTVEIRTTELVEDAKAIFEKYIADTAPKQVNLPADVINNLKKLFLDSARQTFSRSHSPFSAQSVHDVAP